MTLTTYAKQNFIRNQFSQSQVYHRNSFNVSMFMFADALFYIDIMAKSANFICSFAVIFFKIQDDFSCFRAQSEVVAVVTNGLK